MRGHVHNENQPSLLDTPMLWPEPTPIERRMRAMSAAEQAADEIWRRDYPQFVLDWLANFGPGTAEDIRLAWEKRGRVSPGSSKRASGAIYKRLMAEGHITVVGRELSKLYGNELRVYGRVK